MAKKSLKRFSYLFLMSGILAMAAGFYYFAKINTEIVHQEQFKAATLKKLRSFEAKIEKRAQEIRRQNRTVVPESAQKTAPVNLESLLKRAQNVYGEEEMKRREGNLWVDQKNAQMIATLGALQGVLPGGYLTIYDKDQRIGQVTVKTSWDVISLVQPLDGSLTLSTDQYYRVVKE